jgi:Fe-S oxidoreductase
MTTTIADPLGCAVDISPQGLCCVRPLYDFGFLDEATRRLERIVAAMRADIHAGVPLDVDVHREGPGGAPAGWLTELGYVPEAEASHEDA